MLRKIILSSLVLGILSTPSTEVYATELLANENPTVIDESSNAKDMYIKGTVKSFDADNGLVIEYKDENNLTQEVEINNIVNAITYDMVTGQVVGAKNVEVGDEVLVEYMVSNTGESYVERIFINVDDPNAADSVMVLNNSKSLYNINTDVDKTPTEKIFMNYSGQFSMTFNEDTELTDADGNSITLNDLQSHDIVFVWYPSMIDSQATATKAVLVQDTAQEITGTKTIKLDFEEEQYFDFSDNKNVDVPEGFRSFYGSDDNKYVFSEELNMVDSDGNEVNVADLQQDDIVIVEYTGIQEGGNSICMVTSATLDTTDHTVTGTTTAKLPKPYALSSTEDENGNPIIISKIYMSEDRLSEVRIEDGVTTITDINGNTINVADLKTDDVVTIDYTATKLDNELIDAKATNVVVEETTPSVTGTVTIELGEILESQVRLDQNGNMINNGIKFESKDGTYQVIFDSQTQMVDSEGNKVEPVDLQKGDIITVEYTGREVDGKFDVKATSALVEDQVKKDVTGTVTLTLGECIEHITYNDENGNFINVTQIFESDDKAYRIEFVSTSSIVDTKGNKVDIEELKSGDVVTIEYTGTELDGRFNVVATSTVVEQSYEF